MVIEVVVIRSWLKAVDLETPREKKDLFCLFTNPLLVTCHSGT